MAILRESRIAFDRTERSGIERVGSGLAGNVANWTAPPWFGAYVALTAAFLLVGTVLTLSVLSVVPAGIGTVVVVFGLGLGSVAFAPTGSRILLVAARDRMDARSGLPEDPAPLRVDPEATPR